MNVDLKGSFKHLAQGMLMGGADIIPGVSGGTMALIVGIYERLIEGISQLFAAILMLLRRGERAQAWPRLRAVDWGLLLPVGIGIVLAVAIGAKVIRPLLEAYPAQSHGLFFGLVAASLAVPWLRIEHFGTRELVAALTGAAAAFILTGFPESAVEEPPLLRVFLSASIAISAMILPGISGAYLLKVMGLYEATLLALNNLNITYVVTFILGAIVGLGTFSKVLSWLLRHYHDVTMAALIGLMAGALRALWPWLSDDRALRLPETGDPVLSVILLAVLGFAFVAGLTWMSASRLEASPSHEAAER